MARMVAFLVPAGVANGLDAMTAQAHVLHGVDAGAVAAHALARGLSELRGQGMAAAVEAGAFDRVRDQILSEGGRASGRLPLAHARVSRQ